MTDRLVPPNATPLEVALDDILGRPIDEMPVELRKLYRPDECPEPFLPWLAWAVSVDIWDDAWPTGKKRKVIADAIELHRLKGTLEGISRHVALTDAEVVGARVPPDGTYLGRNRTPEEKAAYLARFPQLRVYRFRDRGTAKYGVFLGRRGNAFLSAGGFTVASTAFERIGRRAFLYEPRTGEEEPLLQVERQLTEVEGTAREVEILRIKGEAHGVYLNDRPRSPRYLVDSKASERVVTRIDRRDYTAFDETVLRYTITPGMEPIDYLPEDVAEPGTRSRGQAFPGHGQFGPPNPAAPKGPRDRRIYLPPTTAGLRLFQRIHLHDPTRVGVARGTGSAFLGHTRLGMPPYHAQINVRVTAKRKRRTFIGSSAKRYLGERRAPRAKSSISAIAVSKAARDRIWHRVRTHRPLTLADAPRLDAGFRLGEWISDTQ